MNQVSNFMGKDGFNWFVGVVEDRNDPSALGRVRVRCLGYHSSDLTELPTVDLPWAHVMHPVTDPCMHGMGNTPSFLVEGSYVVGFFRDPEKQQLVIMGSLPGWPIEPADPTKGFNDPRGKNSTQTSAKGDPAYGTYPVDGDTYTMKSGHSIYEPDTNRLAQGLASETHKSLIDRRDQRLSGDPASGGKGIPTATQPFLSAVSDEATNETRGFFEEPQPKGISATAKPYVSGQYPYNHVFESESGHIREIDDSPNAQRLFTQHRAGTFEEIHPTGTKVVKVVGDNYEIIAGTSNIFIGATKNSGDALNLTVNGNVREYIKGDYHLEVQGNYTQKIHKNMRTKIGAGGAGNLEEEINGNHGFMIKGSVDGVIGPLDSQASPGDGDVNIQVVGDDTRIVGGDSIMSTVGKVLIKSIDSMVIAARDDMQITTTSGVTSIKAGSSMDLRSSTSTTIDAGTSMNILASTGIDISTTTGGMDITAVVGDIDIETTGGVINLN